MRQSPILCLSATLTIVLLPTAGQSSTLNAQAVTTASIEGRVRGEAPELVDGAQVRVTHGGSGYTVHVVARAGRFAIMGLEVGGPYSILVRHVGYRPSQRDHIVLTLGQRLQLDFELVALTSALDTVRVSAARTTRSRSHSGIATRISDSALRRLPTIDRDLYDFVRLTPQVSARSARSGISAGGVNNRVNNFLLDGVSERGLIGNFSGGSGQGGRSISIEAVKEYQVLLSPYDPRYGDFAGATVNAVTRRGTNDLRGTAFVYARNHQLARGTPFMRSTSSERLQYGLAVGGPFVRNRVHFFIASELQRLVGPAKGAYVGQNAEREPRLAVSTIDVSRFADLLRSYGIDAGSGGRVQIGNPLANLFARIDGALPRWKSRIVIWDNYSQVDNIVFARERSTSVLTRGAAAFPLSSVGYTSTVSKHTLAVQLYTNLPSGGLNELVVASKSQPQWTTPQARAPLISVAVPNSDGGGGTVFLEAGSNEAAHGISNVQKTLEIADHLTMSLGARHRAAVGVRAEFFRVRGQGQPGAYGSWLFSSLDSLEHGAAQRFRVMKSLGVRLPARGVQYGAYVSDEWRPTTTLSVVFGLRADIVALDGRPPYTAAIDTLFGRRTSDVLPARVHWSPRIGFEWDVAGDGRSRLRGGAGLFVGRPPIGWLGQPYLNHGSGVGAVQCGDGVAPGFVPDYRRQPDACTDGRGLNDEPGGPVNLAHGDLRLAETMKASLAYDRRLPWGVVATVEGLYTRSVADFLVVNLNLAGPRGLDRRGRVLYGEIDTTGRAKESLVTPRFSEVMDLRRQSGSHAVQLAVRLEKTFSEGLEAVASYAYSRVSDVQTPTSGFAAMENWHGGRVVSGAHSAVIATRSGNDIPHRIVVAGTYTAPWRRRSTDISLYYVGESGLPFTFLAAAGQGKGDLNADGTNLNDPIYVPRNASDTSEIIFAGTPVEITAQQMAFERFIDGTDCLRRQRGRIMARNSCRAPWAHVTNASIRQALPSVGDHAVTLQLDIFNVLNLFNDEWGRLNVVSPGPNVPLLAQVRQTPGPLSASQPVFRFDSARARFDSQNVESAYQLQLGLRYSF